MNLFSKKGVHNKLIDLIFYFRSSDERASPGQGRLAAQTTIATQGCNGRTLSVLKWIKAKHCWTVNTKLIQIKMYSSPGVLKKFKWKSGVHLIVTHTNDRSISKNLITRWPKDNRNQIEKRSNIKHIFQIKEKNYYVFWFAGRKTELTSEYLLCRVPIFRFGLKKQSHTQNYKIFFKEEILFWLILVCDKNQTKFVQ